ncbi:ferredoxin [Arcticibacter sp.]|uniref:ferredoxin n=1 Tax=Arcticibacter sp. TaxID=1872630 RepID=UPI003890B545
MVRITQYRTKCIGCNACVEAAVYRWRISRKDGKVTLVQGVEKKGIFSIRVMTDELDDNLRAAAHCPVDCIKVELI